jgi:hypothetical protein
MNLRKWGLLGGMVLALLGVLAALLLPRALLAQYELLFMPPTVLQVTVTNSFDTALAAPKEFPLNVSTQALYYIMRTRSDGNYAGGCRITSGLAGTGATDTKGAHYRVRFLRGATTVLDANLAPECARFFLTNADAWYALPLTWQDAYFHGAYRADDAFVNAFQAATQLPYPPE